MASAILWLVCVLCCGTWWVTQRECNALNGALAGGTVAVTDGPPALPVCYELPSASCKAACNMSESRTTCVCRDGANQKRKQEREKENASLGGKEKRRMLLRQLQAVNREGCRKKKKKNGRKKNTRRTTKREIQDMSSDAVKRDV